MENITLFIFDMDGTMFDTEPISHRIWNEVCGEYGYTLPKELFSRIIGLDNRHIARVFGEYFGEDFPYQEIRSKKIARQMTYYEEHHVPVKDGLRELLAYAAENGIMCAVASSSPEQQICMLLEKAQIRPFFAVIQSGENVPCGKPAPDIFLETCVKAGVQPEHALIFEDSCNGILAADAAKIRAVLVPDMAEIPGHVAALAWRQCRTLAEVPPLLQELSAGGR